MKKILFVLVALMSLNFCFAEDIQEDENEFTWARYEMICYQYGEPTWEQYVYLCEHLCCLLDEEIEL